ncbi:aminotransferase class I/II, partial [Mycobacterium tuberculosis]
WDRINMLHRMGASTVGIRANIAAYHHGESWLDEPSPTATGSARVLGCRSG